MKLDQFQMWSSDIDEDTEVSCSRCGWLLKDVQYMTVAIIVEKVTEHKEMCDKRVEEIALMALVIATAESVR